MLILKDDIFSEDSVIVKDYFKYLKVYKEEGIFNNRIEDSFEKFFELFCDKGNYDFPEEYEFDIRESAINTINIYISINSGIREKILEINMNKINNYEDIEIIDATLYIITNKERLYKIYFCKQYFTNIPIVLTKNFEFEIPQEFIDFRNPQLNQYVEFLEDFKRKFDDTLLTNDNLDLLYQTIIKNKEIFDILKEYI